MAAFKVAEMVVFMNEIGTIILRVSMILSLIAFLLIVFYREKDNKKNPGILLGFTSCIGVLISTFLLLFALITGNFSVEYVYHNTDKLLPMIYKISALWSGSSGSMLFWAAILAVLLIINYSNNNHKDITKIVYGVILLIITNFMFVVSFINNPFSNVTAKTDGFGLSPALQSIGMVFHPPVVIIGFCFFFMAFAYMFKDLKDKASNYKFIIWRWTVWGWILLTAGIISGGVWAYTELGWGGYWAWDPIENSSLVNWLLATAFLHNISKKDLENKNIKFNFVLIALTCFTVLIGTFLTRSGVLKSVHAYNSEGMTIFFGIFLVVLGIVMILLFNMYKKKDKENKNGESWYRAVLHPMNSINAIFIILAALIFGATISPLFIGLFGSDGFTIPNSFYDNSFGVLGLFMLLLIGICPFLASKSKELLIPGLTIGSIVFVLSTIKFEYSLLTRASLAICSLLITNLLINVVLNYNKLFVRRSFLSFFILHLAVIIIAIGFTGSRGITAESENVMTKGQSINIANYKLSYENIDWREEPGKAIAIAEIKAEGPWGSRMFRPELAYYQKKDIHHSRAVVKPGLKEDLYIIFEGVDQSDRILVRVMVLKWVSMVWFGGILLLVGVLLQVFYKSTNLKPTHKLVNQGESL